MKKRLVAFLMLSLFLAQTSSYAFDFEIEVEVSRPSFEVLVSFDRLNTFIRPSITRTPGGILNPLGISGYSANTGYAKTVIVEPKAGGMLGFPVEMGIDRKIRATGMPMLTRDGKPRVDQRFFDFRRTHAGLDLAPYTRSRDSIAILAPANGYVVDIFRDNSNKSSTGNMITINIAIDEYGNPTSERNYHVTMMHLDSIDVRLGDYVSQGQRVGIMGSTGTSTGRHLHIEMMYDMTASPGETIMPLEFGGRVFMRARTCENVRYVNIARYFNMVVADEE